MNTKTVFYLCFTLFVLFVSCKEKTDKENPHVAISERNLQRAMAILDTAVAYHFVGDEMAMARFYNPYTGERSEETGSIWMYSSAIEAANAILHALETHKEHGNPKLYDEHFNRYTELLNKLYKSADYYKGTFTLTSYTQTKEWTVYGVDRGKGKGLARVEGIYNVYDDQQWLVREYLEAYKSTGDRTYLTEAEYLTEYILDGWDCTLDDNGNESGGITWGPGYVTKHACSNGPMVSPLVWLYEMYKDKDDKITYRYIDKDKNRKTAEMNKGEYYLQFAKKVYDWQKVNLLREDGVYADMMGGCDPNCGVSYETIAGTKYRKHNPLRSPQGKPYTYNCGTIVSGAADLFRVTRDSLYLNDGKTLSEASFAYFAKPGAETEGYYTYPTDGFSNWFNGVLMRGYVDMQPFDEGTAKNIESFQQNLDYAYDNFLYKGFLPTNLLAGWKADEKENRLEGMFSFTFAAEYAVLSHYELARK
ncbi:glycoside hydrolase family 76 protein [Dysgonomonas sp. 25]|uniref:glycoside hydrolase family 76 protein n=1 Tax=Dysgonomonas sp. 25 TaxID=2302933 RepID=UPI0013D2911F|nr:glycoside hydrolase family 76 protein [Dysgonomonas sp. 25]NDV68305.1 hydrolase [Dysgonomonas sp. 25]